MTCFAIQECIYTFSVVVIMSVHACHELLIHWTNDLFYYTGLHLLLINKLNHYSSKQDLSSKPALFSSSSNRCQAISESYLDHSDAEGIFLIILAIVGLIAVVVVSIAMGILRNFAIQIKVSGKELMLIGITLFLFLSVLKPSILVCFFQRGYVFHCIKVVYTVKPFYQGHPEISTLTNCAL